MAYAVLACILTASGCGWADWILGKKVKPEYCLSHPDDRDCPMMDANDVGCDSNSECTDPSASVCDMSGSGTCVQCLLPEETTACAGTTPLCIDMTCQKCTQHAQCAASNVCLPDGSCAEQSQVAYVDPTGSDNSICSQQSPCTKLMNALVTSRPYVKLHGMIDEAVTVSGGRALTFFGDRGAKLTRQSSGNGPIVTIQGDGTSLSIYDVSISDAPNSPSGIGCIIPAGSGSPSLLLTRVQLTNNPGGGISISGGSLTVSQSTVSGNAGGGISISNANFNITNSMIVMNGGASTPFGGVRIDGITVAGTHVLDFNTIAANIGPATVNTGVTCGTVLIPLTFSNNIIYSNIVSGGGAQIGGSSNCLATYSDIGPDGAAGANNINADPMFVSAAQGNFHLMAGSQAKDKADPAATLPVDFDGDTRPQGNRRDMGADEARQ